MIPQKVFFVKGIGCHKNKLLSFELALRDAGIEKYNLVKVSSILPPDCIEISKESGLEFLKPGQIVYTVMSEIRSNKFNQLIAASIGVAKPIDFKSYGYLSEYHAFDMKDDNVGNNAEDLAVSMLGTSLGINFDQDLDYEEKMRIFKANDKIVESKNITASAIVREKNAWVAVIAAAIFIL